MRSFASACCWLALAVAAGACSDPEPITVVFVRVESRPGVADAARLDVTVRNETAAVSRMYDLGGRRFPLTFTVTPTEREGDLEVEVTAFDGAGLLVGAGAGAAAIVPDQRVDLTIDLDPSDFVVNSSIAGTQRTTFNSEAGGRQIATGADGAFFVAFVNDCATLGRCDVLARRFDAQGRPAVNGTTQTDGELIANLADEFTAIPSVAIGMTSVFMAWQTDAGIMGVALSLEGGHLTVAETAISQTALATATPDVTALASGEFLVVWSESLDTGDDVIMGRLIAANGEPATNAVTGDAAVFTVSAPETGLARLPIASATGDNRSFVVVWKHAADFFGDASVRARFFNPAGSPAAVGNARVAEFADGGAFGPHVAGIDPDHAVVTYAAQTADDPRLVDGGVVVVQIVGPAGNVAGTPAIVSSSLPTGFRTVAPDVAVRAGDGAIGVTWHQCDAAGDGQGCGILLQPMRPSVVPVGPPIVVNTTTQADQTTPSLAPQPAGFIVTWADESSQPPDESEGAVRARVIYLDSVDVNDGRRGARCGRPDDAPCGADLICAAGTEGAPLCHAGCDPGAAVACPGGGVCTTIAGESACLF